MEIYTTEIHTVNTKTGQGNTTMKVSDKRITSIWSRYIHGTKGIIKDVFYIYSFPLENTIMEVVRK